ncbi:PGPGW domain-containing protein [Mumia sp. DW29H23]|uniref:PGPGW domain-containing protein n=1 Tax=Mumia sp. DW29H23 TaxID=3421241 RepID=UPI003D6802FF
MPASSAAPAPPAVATVSARAQAFVARAHGLIDRLEAWAHGKRSRRLISKVFVSVVGPLVVLIGLAMTVLPGPGLVVAGVGMALLALEYAWARSALSFAGRALAWAREIVFPKNGSGLRRIAGLAAAGAFVVLTTALTGAVTTFLGAQALL